MVLIIGRAVRPVKTYLILNPKFIAKTLMHAFWIAVYPVRKCLPARLFIASIKIVLINKQANTSKLIKTPNPCRMQR